MSVNSDIAQALRTICGEHGGTDAFLAEVTEVDRNTRTCTAIGISDKAGVTYTGILLMAVANDGILYIPKIGSNIIVGNNSQQQPFVLMHSELDEIAYRVGNSLVDFTSDLIKFNKGDNDGLVNVIPLTQKINAVENLLNAFILIFNAHIHPGGTISGNTGPTATPENNNISPITQQSDIEDTKITH